MSKDSRGNRTAVPLQDMAIFTAVLPDGLPSIWGHTKYHDEPVGIVEPLALGPYETPSPIQMEASRYDLEHMYPEPMKVLGGVEVPGYSTKPKPLVGGMGGLYREQLVDSEQLRRPFGGMMFDGSSIPTSPETQAIIDDYIAKNANQDIVAKVKARRDRRLNNDPSLSEAILGLTMDEIKARILTMGLGAIKKTMGVLVDLTDYPPPRKWVQPIYRETPGGESRLDVLAMLRRQRFGPTTSPESYALDKILRKNPHVIMVVFERRVDGNKGHRYSKCIQDIVLRNKP